VGGKFRIWYGQDPECKSPWTGCAAPFLAVPDRSPDANNGRERSALLPPFPPPDGGLRSIASHRDTSNCCTKISQSRRSDQASQPARQAGQHFSPLRREHPPTLIPPASPTSAGDLRPSRVSKSVFRPTQGSVQVRADTLSGPPVETPLSDNSLLLPGYR